MFFDLLFWTFQLKSLIICNWKKSLNQNGSIRKLLQKYVLKPFWNIWGQNEDYLIRLFQILSNKFLWGFNFRCEINSADLLHYWLIKAANIISAVKIKTSLQSIFAIVYFGEYKNYTIVILCENESTALSNINLKLIFMFDLS